MPSSSTIRAYVDWRKGAVFAGEDVECIITFTNTTPVQVRDSHDTAASQSHEHSSNSQEHHGAHTFTALHRAQSPKTKSQMPGAQNLRKANHKRNLSLNLAKNTAYGSSPTQEVDKTMRGDRSGHNHERSISITSIGIRGEKGVRSTVTGHNPDPRRSHGRSASLQIMSLGSGASPNSRSTKILSANDSFSPSTQAEARFEQQLLPPNTRRRSSARISQASTPNSPIVTRTASASFSSDFGFPTAPSRSRTPSTEASTRNLFSSAEQTSTRYSISTPPLRISKRGETVMAEKSSNIQNETNKTSTPRSSGDLYSLSNGSSETLASEIPYHNAEYTLSKNTPDRRLSQRRVHSQKQVENLMMGYAHVQGSFALDGSLVNQSFFEEVKRKGVVGGHGGGGVVGVEKSQTENGLLGSIGLGNIGESLGGLLGGTEPSSIREMRGIARSKTVPLLSTPQSILFVDLRLKPGESRSYSFRFTMPAGLPPTYKGRTIKISYNLVLGTQRAGSSDGQQVKQVEIPFRVLGSVNGRGEILGHDLMSPYVILKDQARTASVPTTLQTLPTFMSTENQSNAQMGSRDDFMSYINELLKPKQDRLNEPLLSPSATKSNNFSALDSPMSMQETIEFAVLQSNKTIGQQSANRFEIARAGRRVAVVKLARPSYRLGESIFGAIDFKGAHIPSFSVFVTLETSEVVDSAIALRSASSIYRATRKIHATYAENTLFCQQTSFSLSIQPSSAPQFVTSGINLEWKLKLEFVTSKLSSKYDDTPSSTFDFFEEVSYGDRGTFLAGLETLPCDSFEAAIPITVYGAVIENVERNPDEGWII